MGGGTVQGIPLSTLPPASGEVQIRGSRQDPPKVSKLKFVFVRVLLYILSLKLIFKEQRLSPHPADPRLSDCP